LLGAGKTCVVRSVFSELSHSVYVNCLSSHTRRSVFNRVLEGAEDGPALERRSVLTAHLAARIPDALSGPTVVVLDGAGQLDDLTVLHSV